MKLQAISLLLFFCLVFTQDLPLEVDDVEGAIFSKHFSSVSPSGAYYFFENFDTLSSSWVISHNPDFEGIWKVEEAFEPSIIGEKGLVVSSIAKKHAISAKLDKPLYLDHLEGDLVFQFEVRTQHLLDCGGAYMKLLLQDDTFDPTQFSNETPYSIMFGPDKCGDENKVHFILNMKNKITGLIEEKAMIDRPMFAVDKITHLYTLHIKRDNTFSIYIDMNEVRSGDFFNDFEPPIPPPEEIPDPTDEKPSDWIDEPLMPDPTSEKPEDWDESQPQFIVDEEDSKPETWLDDVPEYIPDPDAEKPEEWDDDFDGDWEPPLVFNPDCHTFGCGEWTPRDIPNPLYKGKWEPPLVENPLYKGPWSPRLISNPNYYTVDDPFVEIMPIGAVGIEIWTMNNGIMYDDILLTSDLHQAFAFAEHSFTPKFQMEKKMFPKDYEKITKHDHLSGLKGRFLFWAEKLAIFIHDQPLVFIATFIIGGVLPMIYFLRKWKPKSSPEKKKEEEQEPPAIEEEEEIIEKEEKKPKATRRKRKNP